MKPLMNRLPRNPEKPRHVTRRVHILGNITPAHCERKLME
jgi:hypothetical protein